MGQADKEMRFNSDIWRRLQKDFTPKAQVRIMTNLLEKVKEEAAEAKDGGKNPAPAV